jgi:hypothetical protein
MEAVRQIDELAAGQQFGADQLVAETESKKDQGYEGEHTEDEGDALIV